MRVHAEELTELERIVLRKALDTYARRQSPRRLDERSIFFGECAVARDLSLRLT